MSPSRYQLVLIIIVFCLGFSLDSMIQWFGYDEDMLTDQPEMLQCTITIDCDNYYDWKSHFPDEKMPDYLMYLGYPEVLKYYYS